MYVTCRGQAQAGSQLSEETFLQRWESAGVSSVELAVVVDENMAARMT